MSSRGRVALDRAATWEEIAAIASKDEIVLGCVDEPTEARMKEEVEEAARTGDTVGGVFEVVATAFPPAWALTPTGMSASTASSPRR